MNTLFVGIDPGKDGAICAVNQDRKIVLLCDIPTVGTSKSYDRPGMRAILIGLAAMAMNTSICIEEPIFKPNKMMPHTCKQCGDKQWAPKFDTPRTIASQWAGFVLWEGIIVGLQHFLPSISYTTVKPSVWHAELFGKSSTTKQAKVDPKTLSYNHSTSQWPAEQWGGPRGGIRPDRHDAACIADYHMRKLRAYRAEDSGL